MTSDLGPPPPESDLARATEQLRDLPAAPPVEVVDRVLQRVLATPRRAQLVRAAGEGLRVSTTALTALLRHRLDVALDAAAARHIVCEVSRDERLEAVTVELIVQYGADIRVMAATARAAVREVVEQTLGAPLPPSAVVLRHVHVSDVTVGDPRVVDPFDEDDQTT